MQGVGVAGLPCEQQKGPVTATRDTPAQSSPSTPLPPCWEILIRVPEAVALASLHLLICLAVCLSPGLCSALTWSRTCS